MATIRITYGNGDTENVETDDVAGMLARIEEIGLVDRGGGRLARIVAAEILDDVAYQDALEKLANARPVFGRGLGGRGPGSARRTT